MDTEVPSENERTYFVSFDNFTGREPQEHRAEKTSRGKR